MKSVDWLPHKVHFKGVQHLKGWRVKAYGKDVIDGPVCGSEARVSDPSGSGIIPAKVTEDRKLVTCKRCKQMLDRRLKTLST